MPTVTKIKTNNYSGDVFGQIKHKFQSIWALGNLDILNVPLIGFFCSVKCPGNVILRAYDLIRALRDARVPVIGGFQSPMEKECLDLLLRGEQPAVVCPARSIEKMRISKTWREALEQGRLLFLSPFESKHKRAAARLSEQRNHFVAMLANQLVVAHASESGKISALCNDRLGTGQNIYTLDLPENAHLMQRGVIGKNVKSLVDALT